MEFDEAVRKCAALGTECDGITTDWYTGSPYTVVKVGAKFQFAEDSYAVSYRNQCRTN